MKKVFGQTVRDLKRGVNKKVLKVPGIEQKIRDATSSEPWGPHGSDMAELAQASRNYHEYQLIMAVIWKRINDTGKKWRHVYKALTVLEYLVAHGSERVIDEIREHAYQISTLADFQYIDSNGRDQGSNIRRKSQGLVALVNSKEKIQEVRQKAQSNKERYNGAPSSGGAHRNSSHSGAGSYGDRYDNGHNENGDGERSGYGREREMGYRDYDERYGRENYAEGRGRSSVDYQTRSRNQSIDGYTDRSFDDDDRYSSRSVGGKGDDQSHDEREFDRRPSEHSVGTPPSYEEATRDVQNTTRDEGDRDVIAPSQVPSSPVPKPNSPSKSTDEGPDNDVASGVFAAPNDEFVDAFDDFDPRGSVSAAPPATSSPELDIFGLSTPDSANSLAMVPATSTTTTFEGNLPTDSGFGTNFGTLPSSTSSTNQASEDPFGDPPFKAIPHDNFPSQPQNFQPITSFQPSGSIYGSDTLPSAASKVDSFPSFDFGNAFGGLSYAPIDVNGQHSSGSPFSPPELPAEQSNNDILDSIFPRTGFPSQEAQPASPTNMQTAQMNFLSHPGLSAPVASQGYPSNSHTFQTNPFHTSGFSAPVEQGLSTSAEPAQMNRFPTLEQSGPVGSQESPTNSHNLFLPSTASQGSPRNIQATQGSFLQPSGLSVPAASQGLVTNMLISQTSLPQPSGSSAPQGKTNMQSSEINFFQPPGLSGSGFSAETQGSQENMQQAHMNFFQTSGISESSALQELQTSPQANNVNFFESSGLSAPVSPTNMQLQSSGVAAPMSSTAPTNMLTTQYVAPTNLQSAQLNLASGISESSALQEPQTSPRANNVNFFQSSGSSAPVSSTAPTSMQLQSSGVAPPMSSTAPTNMQATQYVAPTNLQSAQNLASQSMLPDPLAPQEAQVSAPTNMQATQSGVSSMMQTAHLNLGSQSVSSDPLSSKTSQLTTPNYMHITGHPANSQATYLNHSSQSMPSDAMASQTAHAAAPSNMLAAQFGAPANMLTAHVNLRSQSMSSDPFASQAAPATSGPPAKSQSKEKFEPKSTVWADTLSRGLVNFNISGAKTNPLDDIGIDFDAINRKEKRLEAKSSAAAAPVVSTITMGKAMGSGSGLGRTAAGGLASPPNPMMGNMGMGMGAGMNVGGYGGNMNRPPMGMNNMNQPPMGMNMGMNMGMGMGMNMAMGQGAPGQPPTGMLPRGPGMPGSGYNPMMGTGGYAMQQPYGGGYR